MMKHKVEICGVDTSKLPVLKNEEMQKLFRQIERGEDCAVARDILINGNLRLVLSIMKRFHHRGENVDDLFQVGCIGLMKAIDNFDLKHKVRFSTYAVPTGMADSQTYRRDKWAIRVCKSNRQTTQKAYRLSRELRPQRRRDPRASQDRKRRGSTHRTPLRSSGASHAAPRFRGPT